MPGMTLGTAAWEWGSAESVIGPGLLIIAGGVVSTTLKSTLQALEFPDASVATDIIKWSPRATEVPPAGFWLRSKESVAAHVSLALIWASTFGTLASPSGPAEASVVAGQVMTGGVVSVTWM